jgi:hypothetical protein
MQVAVMAQHKVPTVNLHDAIVDECGAVPQKSCFNQTGCFCPHCPGLWNATIHRYNPGPGYIWLAKSVIVPALTKLLPSKTDDADELSSGSVVKPAWLRGRDTVVSVSATFEYAVSVRNRTWLNDGRVALQCGGHRYSSSQGSMKLLHTSVTSGTHQTLGKYDSIMAQWAAGDCALMDTTIFYFPARDAFEFETCLPAGATVTNTLPASMRKTLKKYDPVWGRVSTEFPSFEVPSHEETGLGFVEWAGDALGHMPRINRPRVANWSNYIGGLTGGPLLVIEGDSEGQKDHPSALMIASSEAFTVARLMHVGPEGELVSVTSAGSDSRIVGGAQGMTTSFPTGYKMSFLLSGRSGVNAAIFNWGRTLQTKHATVAAKLTLQDDKLSRQLSYLVSNFCHHPSDPGWIPARPFTSPACCLPPLQPEL